MGAKGYKFLLHDAYTELTIECVVCIQSGLITTCLLEFALCGEWGNSKSCQAHSAFPVSQGEMNLACPSLPSPQNFDKCNTTNYL